MADTSERPDSAPLPPERPDYFPVMRPTSVRPLHFVSLSESILGVMTHWIDGHEIACVRQSGKCICKRSVLDIRWTGYLCGIMPDVRARSVIIPITEHAARQSPMLLDSSVDLRGMQFHYWRDKGPACAKCWVKPVEPRLSAAKIPPAFNLWKALISMWYAHCKRLEELAGEN